MKKISSGEYLNEHRILVYAMVSKPKKQEEHEIYDKEGVLCGYYVPEGYYVHSGYVGLKHASLDNVPNFVRRVIDIVCYLNREHSYDVLWGYIEALMRDRLGSLDGVTSSAVCTMMKKYFDKRWDEEYELEPQLMKYYWVVALGRSEKMSLRATHRNKRLGSLTLNKIEKGIESLSDTAVFITHKGLAEYLDMNFETLKYHLSGYIKDLIIESNQKRFLTSSWNEYIKNNNTDTIVRAITELVEIRDSISKKAVCDRSDLSYSTIRNLWDTEKVQDALDDYNDYLRGLNK